VAVHLDLREQRAFFDVFPGEWEPSASAGTPSTPRAARLNDGGVIELTPSVA
jgi:hypothetical protein